MSLIKVSSAKNASHLAGDTSFFAKHETFHPRFGWIKKGYDAVAEKTEIFSLADSHIMLGLGKNMAAAIKYWCSAFKVIEPAQAADGGGKLLSGEYRTTEFGELLFDGESGWDPWLENPASLWLLHWNLLKAPSQATAWHVVFNEFAKTEFTADDLHTELARFRNKSGLSVADSSLHKDLLCILRMYATGGQNDEKAPKDFIGEESLACPFVELGLIQRTYDSRYYQFRLGSKPNLPPEIIVAAALDYVAKACAAGQRTISIANLLYSASCPGLVFKLTENALCAALEEVSRKNDKIFLTDSAGLVQFSFNGDPVELSRTILNDYYA